MREIIWHLLFLLEMTDFFPSPASTMPMYSILSFNQDLVSTDCGQSTVAPAVHIADGVTEDLR